MRTCSTFRFTLYLGMQTYCKALTFSSPIFKIYHCVLKDAKNSNVRVCIKNLEKVLSTILFLDNVCNLLRFTISYAYNWPIRINLNLLEILLSILIIKNFNAKCLFDKSSILYFFYKSLPFKFLYLFMVWSVIIHICRHDNLINSNTTTR